MTDPDTVLDRIEAKLDQLLALQQPCTACEERKREEAAATEQWKREFMQRHGLTGLAEGGLVKGPGPLIGDVRDIDCILPIGTDVVEAANPSPIVDPEAVADSIPVHISPGEAVLPGPDGPIHIRGAYGDQPAEITRLDLDALEGDDQ